MPIARISLATSLRNRTSSSSTDSKLVNGLVERLSAEEDYVIKRPGLEEVVVSPAIAAGQGQGLFTWQNYVIQANANTIYSISGGVSTNLGSIIGTQVPLSFNQVVGDTYLVFHNGANFYTIDKATKTLTQQLSSGVVGTVTMTTPGYGINTGTQRTVTMTIASPAVFTCAYHQFNAGDPISFSTTGTLPTGIVAGQTYIVSATDLTANTFKIHNHFLDDPDPINTSGSQSGVHTATTLPTSLPVTMTIASPCVVTYTAHGLVAGQGVAFHSDGTLPTGITPYQTYQVSATGLTTNTFEIEELAGGVVNTSGSQSGNHKIVVSPIVTFSASPGTTATGTVELFNGGVADVYLTNSGTGYLASPTVTFSHDSHAATSSSAVQATFSCLYKYHQTNPLRGADSIYNGQTFTQEQLQNREGPQGFSSLGSFTLDSVSVVEGGSGYIVPPIIEAPRNLYHNSNNQECFTAGRNRSGAIRPICKAIINSSGVVTGVTVVNPGNYAEFNTHSGDDYTPLYGTAPQVLAPQGNVSMASTISGPWAYGMPYLDGSLYLLQKDTGRIYGSDYNDPTSWNALNFITAGTDTDVMVAIARHLNYIIAFGTQATEFFYDAGLPYPTSPLAVNKAAYMEVGCANEYTIAPMENTLLWVGQSITAGRGVYLLEGLSPTKISTKYIDKYLNKDAMTNVFASAYKVSGHALYVLALRDQGISLVFDMDEKEWTIWTSQSGGVETYFTPVFYNGNVEYAPTVYLQADTTGKLYKMSFDNYDDAGENIYFRCITPILDSGTTKRKFYQSVEAIGDKTQGEGLIRHSDTDYVSWSAYRTLSLWLGRPILYQFGSARRRAWEFFLSDPVALRLLALEMTFDVGELGE